MITYRSLIGRLLVALALAACACTAQTTTAQSVATVEGPRPVAKALENIEATYLVPISYEDVRYLDQSEIATDARGRSIIKGGSASFAVAEAPAPDATADVRQHSALRAVADAIQRYNTAKGKSLFRVTTDAGGVHVVGVQPLLDTPVSISPGQRTAYDLVAEIARAVSAATGRILDAGTVPMPLFHYHQTLISAENEPARSVLERLLKEIPVGYASRQDLGKGFQLIPTAMSWQVWCGPNNTPECALNIHVVAPEGRATGSMEAQLQGGEK